MPLVLTDEAANTILQNAELIQRVTLKIESAMNEILAEAQAGYNASWDARFLKIANIAQEALHGSHD